MLHSAARDEEKSRAKERIFYRSTNHGWDPRDQRPELWRLFNTRIRPGESMRVFPLSNADRARCVGVHQGAEYSVVPLYFARKRPVVERGAR